MGINPERHNQGGCRFSDCTIAKRHPLFYENLLDIFAEM